jgi:hypothetical protein
MSRILANATVDIERAAAPTRLGRFRVEVWGEVPHDFCRVYTIQATSDTLAAQEGLRRFVEDVESLIAEKG